MKRVQFTRYGGPEVMSVGDYILPEPGEEEVRVAVRAAAVNPFDWKLREGGMKLFMNRRFPKGLGTDFAGVVTAAGPKVTNVHVGDEVFGSMDFRKSGAFAQALVVESFRVARKPSQLSFAEAACLPIPAMTAWAAILGKTDLRPQSRIFINGCRGAVGAAAVQLAIAHDAQAAGTCSTASASAAMAEGVLPVIAYGNKRAFAKAGKFDVVFDTLGTLPLSQGLALLKRGGIFVDINPTPGRIVRGLMSGRYRLAFATQGEPHLPDIAELAGKGILRPTIGLEVPFGESLKAIATAETGPRVPGKVVIMMPI